MLRSGLIVPDTCSPLINFSFEFFTFWSKLFSSPLTQLLWSLAYRPYITCILSVHTTFE